MHSGIRPMYRFRLAWMVAYGCLNRVLLSRRMILVLLVESMVLWSSLSPIGNLVPEMGYRVGPWLFVFVSGDPVCQAFFVFGLLFLLAEAPFVSPGEAMIATRAGRIWWAVGRVVAIPFIACAYYGSLLLLSWLLLAPWMTFAIDGWGVVIMTMAETDAAEIAGVSVVFDSGVVGALSPLAALALAFGFEVLGGTLLGLLVAAVNALTGARNGLVPAAFIVLFDLLALNTLPYTAFRFSPVSHARIQLLDFVGTSAHFPTPTDALVFDLSATIAFGILAFWSMRRMEIHSQDRD